MKYITTLILLLFLYNTKAQLPIIEANITFNEKNSSVPFQVLKKNSYEFAISYYIYSGGWKMNNDTYYTILAYKKNAWKKLLLIYNEDSKSIKKTKKKQINNRNAKRLISDLNKNNFWSLSLDSLNIKQLPPKILAKNEVINDTVFIKTNVIRSFNVADGTTYYFEIFQNGKVKILSCESPESYKNVFPEIQTTQNFINSKKAFVDFIESN
ncbi:hypothetical protein [Pedobacter sp. SL55]|uniref:hypothetical protein n=1 Tax=Pedobacter sp. SL55 TaxID=2995161 RepID=UPI00226FB311|nr:hypothetical protein [Pedobacter sp. SL55]WAC39259.1 hypothetical protein OVA16_11635 [Pedobacter sp. SL55]